MRFMAGKRARPKVQFWLNDANGHNIYYAKHHLKDLIQQGIVKGVYEAKIWKKKISQEILENGHRDQFGGFQLSSHQ